MSFTRPACVETGGNARAVCKRGFLRHTVVAGLAGIAFGQLTNSSDAKAWFWSQERKGPHPRWKFAFVNHATTNPFFKATQNGIKDACELLACDGLWLGSESSNPNEMITAFNSSIRSKVDAIAVSLIVEKCFDQSIQEALRAGIPVFAYNSDVPAERKNGRLAYVGQDLYAAGYMLGNRLALGDRLAHPIPSGQIAAFMATKGTLNIQPRADGLSKAIEDSGRKDIELLKDKNGSFHFKSGSDLRQEMDIIRQVYLEHPNINALVGLDGGSTQSVGEVISEFRGIDQAKEVRAAGFDLLPRTLQLLQKDCLEFAIDQQPYAQGFLTTIEMFLFLISGGAIGPADINTGCQLVTKENVCQYLRPSRYEGNSPAGWSARPLVAPKLEGYCDTLDLKVGAQ
jgi:simple sugar transport system substrate-binding protein